MSLSRHGKTYWLDIRIDGKRIRRSLRTTNKNEALSLYAVKKQELGDKHRKGDISFSAFREQYLEWSWSVRPKSTEREEQRLKKIEAFLESYGIQCLSEITPFVLEKLKIHLKETGLSKTTVNLYLQILRFMFNRAIDWELYDKPNPFKKVRFYRADSPVKALSHQDVAKILEEAKKISDTPRSPLQKAFYDLCLFAINTGMRRAEILYLRWSNIGEGEARIKGKGDKIRIVPLNKVARDAIERQPRRGEYVFHVPNRHQRILLVKTMETIRKRAGIDFRFHDFRHYFGSSLAKKGVDVDTVKVLMGHSSIITTQKYFHTHKNDKRRAVNLLGRG